MPEGVTLPLRRAVSRSSRPVSCEPVGSTAGYWTWAGSSTSSKPSLTEVKRLSIFLPWMAPVKWKVYAPGVVGMKKAR